MNTIENFLLDFGLSWTISKLIPYLFCLIAGFLFLLVYKKIKRKKNWTNRLISFVLLVFPISIYFAFFPIYEGDFSNLSTQPKTTISFPEEKVLTVIVLPNCPFCYQSIALMKKIKKRNPKIKISYWVVVSDTLAPKTAILRLIPPEFKPIQRHDVSEQANLAQGTFPCFVLSNKKKALKLWNNNQFGVCALDEIEEFFK
jgi:hypothetical protein